MSNYSVVASGAVDQLRKDNLPRSWLVGSYFGAYTQLSTSLSLFTSVDKSESVDGTVKNGVDKQAADGEEQESDNLCDIDEDVKDAVSLPAVPSHLLNNVVIDSSAESEDCKEKPLAKRVEHCEKDREAYSLLLCLTELMETVTYDSTVNAQSSNVPASGITSRAPSTNNVADSATNAAAAVDKKDAAPVIEGIAIDRISTVHQRDITHTSVASAKKKVVRSVASSLLAFAEDVGLDSLAMAMGTVDLEAPQGSNEIGALTLVEEGVCGTRSDAVKESGNVKESAAGSGNTALSTSPVDSAQEMRVEACRHYRVALSLLCGSGWSNLGSAEGGTASVDDSTLLAQSLSEHVRSMVGALDQDAIYTLTGVRFNSDGSIADIQPGPVSAEAANALKKAAEDEEVESSESEYSANPYAGHEESDYSDEDPNAFGNHSYGAKKGGKSGQGDYGFHFGGRGGYHGENDEEFDYSEENSNQDEEEEDESDWETVGSSEEESAENEVEEEVNVKAIGAAKKGAIASKTAFAKAFQAGLAGKKVHNSSETKKGTDNRVDEVAAALKEIEAQMERHHLDAPPCGPEVVAPAVEEQPEPAREEDSNREEEGASVPEGDNNLSEAVPAPPAPTPVVEKVEEINTVVPPPPPSTPAVVVDVVAAQDSAAPAAPSSNSVSEPAPVIAAAPVEEIVVVIDVSHALRARLLNLCGSLAYLAGDAVGAVQCFRTSLQFDPLLLDSQIKLGSLLVDMDEMKEVFIFC